MRFEKSKELYERACRVIPGGISSNVRASWSPHPMFYVRGRGSRVWDADGNELIDYVLARGPLLLGHSPARVLEAVHRQLDTGLMYAGQHELEILVAEKIRAMVPCAEMVRFSNSGSEAVHAALRLARGATGRMKIVRFEGHYHGWFDSHMWSYAPPPDRAGPREAPIPLPSTKGLPPGDADNLIVLPWNDADLLARALERHAGQVAAVITEPMMCNMGGLLPRPGYLQAMRELCTKHGVVLIFDEVITGFRLAPGGAQEYFGVTPDLAVFAKGLAAGLPVSAVAGRRELMRHFGDLSVTHAGTYNSNAPCMAAALAALDELTDGGGRAYEHLRRVGTRLMEGLARVVPGLVVRGLPAVFHLSFGGRPDAYDYRTYVERDAERYRRLAVALQERGVRVVPEGIWFVSTAHGDEDVDRTLEAARQAAREL